MGQKLQDGKKVLEMSVTTLHSKSRPVQTIHPTDLGLLPSWRSTSCLPTCTSFLGPVLRDENLRAQIGPFDIFVPDGFVFPG